MRTHGCIHAGGDLGADAHACWAFDEGQEFFDASLEYLADGLRSEKRLATEGECTVRNTPPVVERLCELLELNL
jgi:hypothetical protein